MCGLLSSDDTSKSPTTNSSGEVNRKIVCDGYAMLQCYVPSRCLRRFKVPKVILVLSLRTRLILAQRVELVHLKVLRSPVLALQDRIPIAILEFLDALLSPPIRLAHLARRRRRCRTGEDAREPSLAFPFRLVGAGWGSCVEGDVVVRLAGGAFLAQDRGRAQAGGGLLDGEEDDARDEDGDGGPDADKDPGAVATSLRISG